METVERVETVDHNKQGNKLIKEQTSNLRIDLCVGPIASWSGSRSIQTNRTKNSLAADHEMQIALLDIFMVRI